MTERGRSAFFIQGVYYSYDDLMKCVSKIRQTVHRIPDNNITLIANDDLETYASIVAIWLEGKCYVPIHPLQPLERCLDIITQVGTSYVLDSSDETRYSDYHVISTKHLLFTDYDIDFEKGCSDEELAYILFTSGSTGKPKGVKISRGNLAAFITAFNAFDYQLDENDRCLQMFDLTFDLSVMSYLLPLLSGACAYTISSSKIKYQAAFELLDEQQISFAVMVPSVVHYLQPYMDEINLPSLRYSLFAGEALPLDLVDLWSQCAPNSIIVNGYGPTECTILCTACIYDVTGGNKSVNGTMSIGKPMLGTEVMIVDDNCEKLPNRKKGELCLSSIQLTSGYWNNSSRDAESFFVFENKRYYKTGDLCSIDEDGDIMYYGRKDSQIKIQGFRVELSEIEFIARRFYSHNNAVVAMPVYDDKNNCTIQLVVEKAGRDDADALIAYLKKYLPSYMIPARTYFMSSFPMNVNNKMDRKKIKSLISSKN